MASTVPAISGFMSIKRGHDIKRKPSNVSSNGSGVSSSEESSPEEDSDFDDSEYSSGDFDSDFQSESSDSDSGESSRSSSSSQSGSSYMSGMTARGGRSARSGMGTARSALTKISNRTGLDSDMKGHQNKTILGSLQAWRKKKADKRRDKTLVFFETQDLKSSTEKALRLLREDRQRLKNRRMKDEKAVKWNRTMNRLEDIKAVEKERFDTDMAARMKQYATSQKMMTLVTDWSIENATRKKQERAIAEDANRKRVLQEEKDRRDARKEAALQAKNDEIHSDMQDTQEVLALMRRAGVIAGVNAPEPPDEMEEQRETASEVVLMNRPEEETRTDRRRRDFSFFTVDLTHYRNVEVMKCIRIGQDGTRFLAYKLSQGVCPRLTNLNLGWCSANRLGADSLFKACGKTPRLIVTHLDLRVNHIPPESIHVLCRALVEKRALSRLLVLDLRQNQIGTAGALHLAHAVLAGGFKALTKLYVMQNSIEDQGLSGLHKAFMAETVMCQDIECVDVCENPTTPAMRRRLFPCPLFFRC